MDPFTQWLLGQAGLDPNAYQRESLRRRTSACLRHLRSNSRDSARALLERQPQLIPGALSSVLIGVTDFFRDEAVFHAVETLVLPDLLSARDTLRVYSAGVSTGEELYSTAILVAELGALERSRFLGLDCRTDAIERARGGEFTAAELARLNPRRQQTYFHRKGSRWVVDAAVRARMAWRVGNLFTFSEGEPWDIILFRNVAIYLDPAHAAAAWRHLCGQLRPGGFLVTGRAEQPSPGLPLRRVTASIYRRV